MGFTLNPSAPVEVEEPFIADVLPRDEFRQHLPVAARWM